MQLHEDGRPILRFSLFEKWWQNKQTAMEKYFPEERESTKSKWMNMGSMVARALEERPIPSYVSDVQPADISEYRIVEDMGGYLVRGTIDKFITAKNTVIDNKTLKRKMTKKEEESLSNKMLYTLDDFLSLQNKFDEKDAKKYKTQLTFYQVLVAQRHGHVDETAYIEIIPVIEDCSGVIRRTGESAYMVPVPVTDAERNDMRTKIISTAKDIVTCWTAYHAGHIKI